MKPPKDPAQLTDAELKDALARTSDLLGRSAVRDYELFGPYFESRATRITLNRWQALEAERVKRAQTR